MRRVVWALLLWGGLLVAATAGVVEDAEEALKNVPSDRPYQAAPGTSQDPGRRFPTRASSVSYGASSSSHTGGQSSSGTSRVQGATVRNLGGSATSSADPTPEAPTPTDMRRSAQESKDLALSFAGVLVLLFLVAVAGYYSRRVHGNSD